MTKEKYYPTLVLTVICLAVALLLAAVNMITAPIIEAAQNSAANAALLEVYPDGSFGKDCKLSDLSSYALPKEITAVYKEDNGGFVFEATVVGYKAGLVIMCGVDAEGKIVGTKVIVTNETPDIAGKVFDKTDKEGFYIGATATDIPDLVAEVTPDFTAGGYASAVTASLSAFAVMNGGEAIKSPEEILQDNCNAALGTEGVKFTRWFRTEVITGVDEVYEAENDGGRVYVIGESFIGVKNGEVVTEGIDLDDEATALGVDAVISASTLTEITERPSGISKTTIKKIYKTESGNYVFEAKASGYEYAHGDLIFKMSISADGSIIDCLTLEHGESKGYGDKCATEEYYESWRGVEADQVVESDGPIVDGNTDPGAIVGATQTSNGYQKAVKRIFNAFKILTEGGND